jgi:hypothetical protein
VTHPVAPLSATPPQDGPVAPPPGPYPQGEAVPPGAVPPPGPIPGFPAEEKPKKSIGARILGIATMILVALVVIGFKVGLRSVFSDEPMKNATVGYCVTSPRDIEDTEVIACADAKAGYTIVGRVPDVTKAAFDADTDGALCAAYPATEAALWVDGDDVALCLAPVK